MSNRNITELVEELLTFQENIIDHVISHVSIVDAGDVIFDSATGPLYYMHTALVLYKGSKFDMQESKMYNFPIVAGYGYDQNMQQHISYQLWKMNSNVVSNSLYPKATKRVLRFKPPSEVQLKEMTYKLPTVENFREIVSRCTIKLLERYENNMSSNKSKQTLHLLNAGLPNCGPPQFKHFDRRYKDFTTCNEEQDETVMFCSKFVIQALQISLFDWLRTEKTLSEAPITVLKEIIKLLLPVAAEKCAPRFMMNTLLKSKYWITLRNTKPSYYKDIDKKERVWTELQEDIQRAKSFCVQDSSQFDAF